MTARVDYAPYAYCPDCSAGSEVGISTSEAEAWAAQHDKDNHAEDD